MVMTAVDVCSASLEVLFCVLSWSQPPCARQTFLSCEFSGLCKARKFSSHIHAPQFPETCHVLQRLFGLLLNIAGSFLIGSLIFFFFFFFFFFLGMNQTRAALLEA